jgi:hypothetical protein
MKAVGMIIAILFVVVASAAAQNEPQPDPEQGRKRFFYQWVDAKGTVHIADSIAKVPEQYREAARRIEAGSTQDETIAGQQTRQAPSSSGHDSRSSEAADRQAWQQRIRDWKVKQAEAEKRYQDLDRERNDLIRPWGSAALAPIASRQRIEKIGQEMHEVQQEIVNARNMIEAVIPEEARKAGVPPGWLRD